jgi:acyl-CoA synthetase (AMP-forming)/AMP-acid ligase II
MLSRMSPRPLHLADILEGMADAVPDRRAVITMDHAYTFAEIDERSTRLANHLIGLGIEPGEHVAVHSDNRIEWVDAFYGCLKARAVPININYKYLRDELAHLYDNSDAVAAIVSPDFLAAAQEVMTDKVRHVIVLGEQYDAALAAASTVRPDPGRSPDDLYVVYTGGTTGNPKGVMWRIEDIIRAALNQARYGAPIESVEKLGEEAAANENPMVLMAAGPMMHGGSQWIMGNAHVAGQSIALYTEHSFDAHKVLDLTEKAKVISLAFLGDAMARPIAEAVQAEPERWDLSGLMALSNGAAPLSPPVREQLYATFPGKFILDTFGSSEGGATGSHMDVGDGKPITFAVTDEMEVFDADMQPAAAGVRGMFGRTGPIPLGYYKDEAKTAATFCEVDGRRWVLPGDFARREQDGTITLLGRGSVCINTGGEKVHPEEVEATLKRHPGVFDAVVVGTPHDRWGQQVTALVERREDSGLTEDELIAHCHGAIANYKCPKTIFFVDAVPRTPVSKVDYPASTARALELLAAG